jgi:hypothetical protein
MGVKTIAKKAAKNITIPSKYYFYVPLLVSFVLFLIIGYFILKKSYNEGGITYYSSECTQEAKEACLTSSDPNCEDNYLLASAKCEKTVISKTVLVSIHIFTSLFLAVSIAFGVLKLAFYIKNPKVAVGIFVLKAIF